MKILDLENHGKARQLSIKKSPIQWSCVMDKVIFLKKKSKKEKQEKNTCIPFFERTCIHLEISAKIKNKLLEP